MASLAQNHLSLKQNEIAVEQSYFSMKQTEIALKQSYTVQRLTYLTIGYLPMGLLAVCTPTPSPLKVDESPETPLRTYQDRRPSLPFRIPSP